MYTSTCVSDVNRTQHGSICTVTGVNCYRSFIIVYDIVSFHDDGDDDDDDDEIACFTVLLFNIHIHGVLVMTLSRR